MSQNNEKRQRGKNFSLNEEYFLVDLVEIHKSVLENKKSDAVTWRQKNETWEKLASEFARFNTELESKTEDVNDSIQELQSKTDDINDFIQEDFVNLIEIDEEVDKEMYPSSSKWNPTILKEKVSSKLNTKKFNQRKTKLEDEKIKLIKIQQDFYRDENARAAEKHKLEMEKYQNEITSIRLKNELIQNEIKEKKQRI
ncbi:uncharacterized protein LOC119604569 [Lucilia sericata]|uniref:uncharacterized protein LOC119604569 n=1 Tax=Lucilia sericata TaxID=13632 RepID=UPI0018A7F81E|nr:uncharacterized protein LOC119604569 [Lucilia sericata]